MHREATIISNLIKILIGFYIVDDNSAIIRGHMTDVTLWYKFKSSNMKQIVEVIYMINYNYDLIKNRLAELLKYK